jgi:hypothetical protein
MGEASAAGGRGNPALNALVIPCYSPVLVRRDCVSPQLQPAIRVQGAGRGGRNDVPHYNSAISLDAFVTGLARVFRAFVAGPGACRRGTDSGTDSGTTHLPGTGRARRSRAPGPRSRIGVRRFANGCLPGASAFGRGGAGRGGAAQVAARSGASGDAAGRRNRERVDRSPAIPRRFRCPHSRRSAPLNCANELRLASDRTAARWQNQRKAGARHAQG